MNRCVACAGGKVAVVIAAFEDKAEALEQVEVLDEGHGQMFADLKKIGV